MTTIPADERAALQAELRELRRDIADLQRAEREVLADLAAHEDVAPHQQQGITHCIHGTALGGPCAACRSGR